MNLDKWLCHDCAMIFDLTRQSTLNQHAPTFCPFCGARHSIERVVSSFKWHHARCFHGIPAAILQPMAEIWAANAMDERATWPLFKDYVMTQLAVAVAKNKAKSELPC